MAGESFGQRIDIAQRIAQKAKTPSININISTWNPTEPPVQPHIVD
jgi:hypothetical protein